MPTSNEFFVQFLRLASPYWNSENKAEIRLNTLFFIGLTVLQIVLAVVTTEWSAALFNALEQHSMSDLWKQIGLLILIFLGSMGVTATHLSIKRKLQIGWRSWLTNRVLGQWMHKGRHCLVTHVKSAEHDNPDGRIAEDIRIAIDEAISLFHSLFYSILLLVSFSKILWNLSGSVIMDIGITEITIKGHLVWIAIVYAVGASILGWWIGLPLTAATNNLQTAEANFRYGLVKARENALGIALMRGETTERNRLISVFFELKKVFDIQTLAWRNILLFNSGYSVLSMAFPILVSAPRYILGSISLGALMQSAQAFQHMASALSWPVNNIAIIAQWRASVERVLNLVKALDDLELEIARPDPQRIVITNPDQHDLILNNVCISKFNGECSMGNVNLTVKPGDRVLMQGDSGEISKLFKAIAGLWRWGNGRIELPDGDAMFFMPPRPYLPDGPLIAAICYPNPPENYPEETLIETLRLVDLEGMIPMLYQCDSWDKTLSREEQQRLGLARLLVYRPKWILFQEALDSLPPEQEIAMLRLINQTLPDASMLTIMNQPNAGSFHNRTVKI